MWIDQSNAGKGLYGLTTLRQAGSVWIDHSKAGRVCGLITLRQEGSVWIDHSKAGRLSVD